MHMACTRWKLISIILDFSAEAEANHAKYLEERHELLRQHKVWYYYI